MSGGRGESPGFGRFSVSRKSFKFSHRSTAPQYDSEITLLTLFTTSMVLLLSTRPAEFLRIPLLTSHILLLTNSSFCTRAGLTQRVTELNHARHVHLGFN